jgi:hypothetical protein
MIKVELTQRIRFDIPSKTLDPIEKSVIASVSDTVPGPITRDSGEVCR